jgi:pimeloyl-ACP methyl ester carboxylesterase
MADDPSTLFQYQAGGVSIYTAPRPMAPARPLVVLLHGALRTATALTQWTEFLGDAVDVALVDLPGHGKSAPIESATVQAMAAALDSP